MKTKGLIILTSVCLLLISMPAGAGNYKAWISSLPDRIGRMQPSAKPDSINMESGDQRWSVVHQGYASDKSEKYVGLTLVGGQGVPHMTSFQMMYNMKMETEEQIIKPVTLSKYKGLLNLGPKDKRGTLMIRLGENMIAIIEVAPITKETEIITLAEQLPLDRFAAQAK